VLADDALHGSAIQRIWDRSRIRLVSSLLCRSGSPSNGDLAGEAASALDDALPFAVVHVAGSAADVSLVSLDFARERD